MTPSLKFEGGQELLARLQQLSPAVSKKVQREALRAGAESIRSRMEELAKPRGQRFDDPIVISNARGKDAQEVAIWVGPIKAFFYGFEFGTKHQPARPFARPAFDTGAAPALGIIKQRLWDALRKRLPGSFGAKETGTVGGRFE